MTKRRWIALAIAVAGLVLVGVMLFPAGQYVAGSDTEASPAPDFSSTIKVSPARIILPPRSPGPAQVVFDLTNSGKNTVNLTQVAVENAPRVNKIDASTPDPMEIANLPVEPGATVRFGPTSQHQLIASYDPNMVPGAQVQVTLTFGTAATITVPATVEAGTGPNGLPRSGINPD